MPNPYTSTPDEVISISPGVLRQRPELALEIAVVASYWSDLELQLTQLFSALFMGRERVAFEMYHAVIDRELRKTLFVAAGKELLGFDLIEEIKQVYADVRRVSVARNAVVHGIWAVSNRPDKQDALLLCDQKTYASNFADYSMTSVMNLFEAVAEVPLGSESSENLRAVYDLAMQKNMQRFERVTAFKIYNRRDFEDIRERIASLRDRARELCVEVWRRSSQEFSTSMLRHIRGLGAALPGAPTATNPEG